jgi:hypothetical protein
MNDQIQKIPEVRTTTQVDGIAKGTRVWFTKAEFDDGFVITVIPTASVQKFKNEEEYEEWVINNFEEL